MSRRKRVICINLDPSEHNYIKRLCEKRGISFSKWVSNKIFEELKNVENSSKVYHKD